MEDLFEAVSETTGTTQLDRAPTYKGPFPGEVLGGRYELDDFLADDPFSNKYRSFDRVTGEWVVVRVVRSALVPTESDRKRFLRHLQPAVGIGGARLLGLRDAGREHRRVYTVEPMPSGIPLDRILQVHTPHPRVLSTQELLPILEGIDAALKAIPHPLQHGDIRPENIWVDGASTAVAGAFLVPALPSRAIRQAISAANSKAFRCAPETLQGHPIPASDLFATASLIFQSLTGSSPTRLGLSSNEPEIGYVEAALSPLLHRNPEARPTSLDALVGMLARQAGPSTSGRTSHSLDAPSEKHRRVSTSAHVALQSAQAQSEESAATLDEVEFRADPRRDHVKTTSPALGNARPIVGAGPESTRQLSIEELEAMQIEYQQSKNRTPSDHRQARQKHSKHVDLGSASSSRNAARNTTQGRHDSLARAVQETEPRLRTIRKQPRVREAPKSQRLRGRPRSRRSERDKALRSISFLTPRYWNTRLNKNATLVVGSIVLGLVIVSASLWFVRHQRETYRIEREQRIEQRIEQLRRTEPGLLSEDERPGSAGLTP
ncbi:MAG: hypothetical protein AAF355_05835 [Myxococcota bacterium]